MDFDVNDDQQAILEAIRGLLDRHAGPGRAIELQPRGDYDHELEHALEQAGFSEVARDESMGPLEAALVAEAVSYAAGVMSIGASTLVAPALSQQPFVTPIAITSVRHRGPIRFGAQARTLLVLGEEEARVVALEPGESTPVDSNFGYPMGSAPDGIAARGESLGGAGRDDLERWWRVSLAVEAAGTMRAALDQTVAYLKERRQFGRTIASFQAVQHRLATCAISVEGSRWLALEAAFKNAPAEMSATAAAYAIHAAGELFAETHQLSGAIGFTREHDLHVWSMRLQALRAEMDGVTGHRRAIAAARWGAPS